MALLLVETLCNDHNILCTLFFLRQYKQQLNFLLNNEVILYIPLKSTQTFHCKTSFLIFSTSYDTSHILIFILIEVSVGPLQWEFSTWMWRIIFHHIIQVTLIENDRLFLQLNQNEATDCHPLIHFVKSTQFDVQSVVKIWFYWRNIASISLKLICTASFLISLNKKIISNNSISLRYKLKDTKNCMYLFRFQICNKLQNKRKEGNNFQSWAISKEEAFHTVSGPFLTKKLSAVCYLVLLA